MNKIQYYIKKTFLNLSIEISNRISLARIYREMPQSVRAVGMDPKSVRREKIIKSL